MSKNYCEHIETKIVEQLNSVHKHKVVCVECNRFIKWASLKTPEQKAIDKKKHIAEYYKKQYDRNLFIDN